MEDIKASDVLSKNLIKERKEQEIAKTINISDTIPSNYIEVKLSSMGKLDLPAIVHVRDYNYDEALMIAEMKEDKITESMIQVLNNIVYEDIDMGKAHIQDATEILLSVYGTWYNPKLELFKYYVNEDLTGEAKEEKSNISVASIPINNISTKPIKEEVKVPIQIKSKNFKAKFILPKIENDILAWKFAVANNLEKEQEISDIISAVKSKTASTEQIKIYDEFTNIRGKDYIKALQAQLIFSINDEELVEFADKLKKINDIPLSYWTAYNNLVKEKFNFGVQEETSFRCSITNETITRRFHFRPLHFLYLLDKKDNTGLEISFG